MTIGVGSSGALNAFNIGQAANQGQSAVGQAIRAIVEKGDKLQLAQTGQESGLATGIGVAEYKNQLEENQRGNVYGVQSSGQPIPLGLDVKTNRSEFINLKPEDFGTDEVEENERLPIFGTEEAKQKYFEANPNNTNNPNLTPTNNFDFSDPNRPLTEEEEDAYRLQNNLPPRQR